MAEINTLPEFETPSGLNIESFYDNQLLVYSVRALATELPQQWADIVIQILQNWSPDYPYLALHDLSMPAISMAFVIRVKFNLLNLAITPSGSEAITALLAARPTFRASIAVVLNQSTSGYMGQIYSAYQEQAISSISYRIFYDYQTAFEWLEGMCKHG